MSISHWAFVGAFLGLGFGAVVGAGDLLLHYHSLYNRHHELYPLPIALTLVAVNDAIIGIMPGAIAGYLVGLRLRYLQTYRGRVLSQQAVDGPEVWPSPPTPPETKDGE